MIREAAAEPPEQDMCHTRPVQHGTGALLYHLQARIAESELK